MKVQFVDGYYRAQHVTGPGSVLVSIAFGEPAAGGPEVVALASRGRGALLDVSAYVQAVIAGVARANRDHTKPLKIKRIAYVPDDHPTTDQVEHVAYKIACSVLDDETRQTIQRTG